MSAAELNGLQPVVVLGAGRSGTKFLRDLFADSPEVATVPYDVGYIWRYANERVPHDEFEASMVGTRTRQYVRRQLPRLSNLEERPRARFLLEKSVPNALRAAYVHAILPEAKFVHLVRDGRAVVESALRVWSAPPERGYLLRKLKYFPWSNYRYAIWYLGNLLRHRSGSGERPVWGPRYRDMEIEAAIMPLEVICARQWARCIARTSAQLQDIPPEQRLGIRYEDLLSDEEELQRLCQFIGLADIRPVMAAYRSRASREHLDKWRKVLSTDQLDLSLPHLDPGLRAWGYVNA